MMVTIIALIVLLMSFLFIKSTIIIPRKGDVRPTKANVFLYLMAIILSFVPIVNWAIIIGTSIITLLWYCSNGFDEHNLIELSETTPIGRILLFKI